MNENEILLAIYIASACVLLISLAYYHCEISDQPKRRKVCYGVFETPQDVNYAIWCESLKLYAVVENGRPQPDGSLLHDIRFDKNPRLKFSSRAEPGTWIECGREELQPFK